MKQFQWVFIPRVFFHNFASVASSRQKNPRKPYMPQGSRFLLPGPFLIRTSWRRSLKKQITSMRYDETPSLKSRGLFLVKKRKQIHRKKEKNLHILQGHEVCGQPLSVVCTTGEQGFLQLKQAFVSTLFFLPLSAKCSSVVEKPPWLESRNPSYSLFCSFPNRWGRKTSLKRNWVDLFLTSSQGHHSIFFFHFGPADSVKQKWMIAIPVLFSLVGGKLLASYIYIEIVWYMRAPM